MKLDKLARKLKRDLAANPKRAGLLGLMLLVACYFWAPLVTKWLGNGAKGKGGQTQVILGDDLPIQDRPKARNQPRWDKVLAWMESDPRMAPAHIAADLHPFGLPPASTRDKAEERQEENTKPSPIAVDVDPRKLGVTLNGVLFGSKRRHAIINSRAYAEAEKVKVKSKEGAAPLWFELSKVEERSIQLTRLGKSYELKLDEPQLGGETQ